MSIIMYESATGTVPSKILIPDYKLLKFKTFPFIHRMFELSRFKFRIFFMFFFSHALEAECLPTMLNVPPGELQLAGMNFLTKASFTLFLSSFSFSCMLLYTLSFLTSLSNCLSSFSINIHHAEVHGTLADSPSWS